MSRAIGRRMEWRSPWKPTERSVKRRCKTNSSTLRRLKHITHITHSQTYCIRPSGQTRRSPSPVAMRTCLAAVAGSASLSAPRNPVDRGNLGTGRRNPGRRGTGHTGRGVVAAVASGCRSDRASWRLGWCWSCLRASSASGEPLPSCRTAVPN